MDITTPGFTRFSRFGANLGRLHVTEASHAEGLDGTDELRITCAEDLNKNDYIVWQDRRGVWHEHIVDTFNRMHDDTGAPLTVATCLNSIAETWDDYVEDKRPSGSAYAALNSILETSRWAAGECTQEGTASHTFYHISVREAIGELIELWGGELETVISCDGDRVTARELRVRATRGDQNSPKRFTWSKDLISIARDVASDNPKSRIYAYGKGEETETGGFGRRLTIESVNDGKAYVEDEEATKVWGHPMPNGTIAPAVGVYLDENCDDADVLLEAAKAALEAAKVPTVTYRAEVIDLVTFGRDWEDVALGDRVTIVDKGFSDDGIRLRGRVSKLERDLLTYDTTVTFGTLVDAIANPWQSLQAKLASLSKRSSNWDLAGTASVEWLNTLVANLNAAYNQAGTYHYSSFEKGEIWSNVPLDANGNATQAGGWAMNINGLGFRLASSLNADGSWNWRTFGNGQGFTADEIIAGRLKVGLIQAVNGKNFWNLDTDDFRIAANATLGTRTVQQVLDGVDATITDVSFEYAQNQSDTTAPQTGWQEDPPSWREGWYIWQRTATTTASGTTYSDPICISGKDGVGISSTTIEYGTSANGTDQPTRWQTGVPSVSQGQWLWVRTTYVYTDSSQKLTYSKSYVGTDGEDGTSVYVVSSGKVDGVTTVRLSDGTTMTINDGEDGETGRAGANGYVHIAWATNDTGTQGFSTSVATGKTYIGVYTDNTEADSTRPSDYNWSLIKGADGEDGVGISSIEEQYYLSTSNSDCVGGSWQTTQPTWESGKHIWTRTKITWDDNETSYTRATLAQALTQANKTAKETADELDELATTEGIFNALTNNGALQGLYMQDGQLYINASYIKTGQLLADLIKAGKITGGTNTKFLIDIDNGTISAVNNLGIGFVSEDGGLSFKAFDWQSYTQGVYAGDGTVYGAITHANALSTYGMEVTGKDGIFVGTTASKEANASAFGSLYASQAVATAKPSLMVSDEGTVLAGTGGYLAVYGGKRFSNGYLTVTPGIYVADDSDTLTLVGKKIEIQGQLGDGLSYQSISFKDADGTTRTISVKDGLVTTLK